MADALPDDDAIPNKLDLRLWRRLLGFALPYRGSLAIVAVQAVLVAGCDITIPLLTKWIIDEVAAHGADAHLRGYVLAYIATFMLLSVCIYLFIRVIGTVTSNVSHDIRETSFDKLQELTFSYYDKKAVGWLMARLTGDCASLSRVMGWGLLDIVWGTTLLSAMAVTMFILHWKLALIVVTIVPLLLAVSRYFQIRLLKTSRALRKANSITTGAFNEGITGVRTSKSLVRESQNLAEFSELTATMYRHAVSNQLYSAVFLPTVLTICSLGIGLALWRGGIDVLGGTITLGTLVAFIQYANHLQHPAQELANTMTMIQGAQASAERIIGLLDTAIEIEDSAAVRERVAKTSASNGTAERGSLAASLRDARIALDGFDSQIQTIEFRDVSFGYLPGQTVLKNFNLTVEAGQSVALVGPTGGGKSTIVGLVCRFYEPTSGTILINGVDYRERSLSWLQSQLGMVLQQPHLFSGTIRENIRYGRLDATDEEVERAARLTNAHEFIAAMKDGYNATVGEGGNQLSTGQKQLIALARAILANPQIFVMDEATSSVDTQTERQIQRAVEQAMTGRISFVIAHRLSTIKSADRILVIGAGKIIEQGSHHDLLLNRGRYYELYTNQFTEEKETELLAKE